MASVLIVDDERSIRVTLGEFLRMDGHLVDAVEDAEGARALLDAHDWDVVVTDIVLPRVTGVELLHWIRDTRPDVQVIMMTGEPTVDSAAEAVRAGAFDYLSKPVTKEAIRKTVAAAARVKCLADERSRLARDNRRYQEHLEELVRQRTAALEAEIAERIKVEESLRGRTAQLDSVRAVAMEITRELDLDTLLELILRRAFEMVGASAGSLLLHDPAGRRLVPRLRLGSLAVLGDSAVRMGEGIDGRVASTRVGHVINDYRAHSDADPLLLEQTAITAVMVEPLLCREILVGVIGVVRDDGRDFCGGDQELLRLLAAQAAVAIENARLHRASIHRSEQLDSLLRSTRIILQGLDFKVTLDRILGEASRIAACPHVKVLLLDREGGVLRPAALLGTGMVYDHVLRVGEGFSGIVAATDAPVQVQEVQSDSRNCYRDRDRALGIVGYLGLPIRVRGELVGVLSFNSVEERVYNHEEVAFLESFAELAAIAIENARLFRSVKEQHGQLRQLWRRLAEIEEAERQRLSRELHDQVGQGLTALGLNLSVLEAMIPPGTDRRILGRIQDAQQIVQETVGRIRNVMAELRPPVLDDYGLPAALRWSGTQFAARTGVAVTVCAEDLSRRIPHSVETALFRAAQEALTNVAKHARATRVVVMMKMDGDAVSLTVEDDGCGFDLIAHGERKADAHWGLLSMRERVEAEGGIFRIESAPGQGTRVVVEAALG